MRLQAPVQVVEHDARLDRDATAGDIKVEYTVEIFRAVDDQRRPNGLPTLRGAAAARQHGCPLRPGDGDRPISLGSIW
jgi:hypothetical protein